MQNIFRLTSFFGGDGRKPFDSFSFNRGALSEHELNYYLFLFHFHPSPLSVFCFPFSRITISLLSWAASLLLFWEILIKSPKK
jgi:hypothetical protein